MTGGETAIVIGGAMAWWVVGVGVGQFLQSYNRRQESADVIDKGTCVIFAACWPVLLPIAVMVGVPLFLLLSSHWASGKLARWRAERKRRHRFPAARKVNSRSPTK